MPRPELRMTVVYLILASIWVICTNYAVSCVLSERPISTHTVKGLNLIVTTSVLLYFVLQRAYRGWRKAERKQWKLLSEMSAGFRALSARAENQREAERTRISRELHDQLGQALTGLKLDLRWIENQLENRDDVSLNPLTDRLIETQERVDGMLATVRTIATDLRPDALDNLGLIEAIQEEAGLFSQRTGLVCEVHGGGVPKSISTMVATAAFRILQEALTNVIRHAEASRVVVACKTIGNWLELTVSDNGRGLPPDLARAGLSLGLLGMRERAELLGGQLKIATGKAGGTLITAMLPCKTTP